MSAVVYTAAKSLHLYAHICALLMHRGPQTADELREATGCVDRDFSRLVRQLRDRGTVYVKSWVPGAGFQCHTREVWALGSEPDAPRPLTKAGTVSKRTSKVAFRIHTFMFALVMKALEEGADIPAIVDLTGLSRHTVQALVRYMRELRMIHIGGWLELETGGLVSVWKLGDKRNAKRPKRTDQRERKAERAARAELREQCRQFTHLIAAPLAQ